MGRTQPGECMLQVPGEVISGVALATGEWGWVITDVLGDRHRLFGARQVSRTPRGR
jgi:hypothetical protein